MVYTEVLKRVPQKLIDAGFPSVKNEKYILKWDNPEKPKYMGFNSVKWKQDVADWVLDNIESIEYTGERT